MGCRGFFLLLGEVAWRREEWSLVKEKVGLCFIEEGEGKTEESKRRMVGARESLAVHRNEKSLKKRFGN